MMSILLISLACCLHSISALRCHQCFSYKSMDDCTRTQSIVECKPEQTRCKNITVSYAVDMAFLKDKTLTGYLRGCETEKNCKENKCEEDIGKKLGASGYSACEISCCEGNLCPKNNTTDSSGGVVRGARNRAVDLTAGNFRQTVVMFAMISLLVVHCINF